MNEVETLAFLNEWKKRSTYAREIEDGFDIENERKYDDYLDGITSAISVLEKVIAVPLTMEEINKRVGQKVWVQQRYDTLLNGWTEILKTKDGIRFKIRNIRWFNPRIQKDYLVYLDKPQIKIER